MVGGYVNQTIEQVFHMFRGLEGQGQHRQNKRSDKTLSCDPSGRKDAPCGK